MDNISSARAMLLSEEDALAGNTTLSLETCGDLGEDDVFSFITENFGKFIKTLRFLKKEDQEMLLSYYLLGVTQNTLALIHKSTQTVCSFRLRMAVKTLGTFMMTGGGPSEELLHEVLEKAGFENALMKVPLSTVVMEYVACRSFLQVANKYALHRPDIRRSMSRAMKAMMESIDPQEAAIAAWLNSLIDKVSPVGVGFSRRKSKKMGNLFRKDPAILSQFRVSVTDPDFGHMFVSKANR